MRQISQPALGLGLALVLITASPWLLAAQPRHKKPAKTRDAPAKAADDDAKPSKSDDAKPIVLEETPPPVADDAPEPATKTHDAPAKAPDEDDTAKTSATRDAPDDADVTALGRREAARLAAGRFEVAVAVGAGVGMRHFSYRDAIGYSLAPYRLPVAPMASFELEAYPAASSDVPFLRDLGLSGYVSRAFGFDS
ncbi:MAG TPA: hypothetical protein VNG33_02790, partial [Polyangiaceae bacterium]|nr:hypothetical protein [Polyangiaceae bacterium]